MNDIHGVGPPADGNIQSMGGKGRSRVLIGNPPNHWLHSSSPPTFDLTRPEEPDFIEPDPKSTLRLCTTTSDILVTPQKTALLIIDMQNFFLSSALGRDPDGPGNKARKTLLDITIPSARRAGIRVIWLNWGLTDRDLDQMPPALRRAFGSVAAAGEEVKLPNSKESGLYRSEELNEVGKSRRLYQGLGSEIGPVTLEDGSVVDAGRLLFAKTWNADLPPDLRTEYLRGRTSDPPDVWVGKNRMSGLWGATTPATNFLEEHGIRTLLFAGVNTDQCVGGSLADAFSKGYDCILVEDVCGTTSPQFATDSWIYNTAREYGFVTSSEKVHSGVEQMLRARHET